jgi:hypothetical protein
MYGIFQVHSSTVLRWRNTLTVCSSLNFRGSCYQKNVGDFRSVKSSIRLERGLTCNWCYRYTDTSLYNTIFRMYYNRGTEYICFLHSSPGKSRKVTSTHTRDREIFWHVISKGKSTRREGNRSGPQYCLPGTWSRGELWVSLRPSMQERRGNAGLTTGKELERPPSTGMAVPVTSKGFQT